MAEQTLERKPFTPIDPSTIEIYEPDGTRITNRETLEAIAETQEIIAAWDARMERYEREGVFDGWEEDEEIDSPEEENS